MDADPQAKLLDDMLDPLSHCFTAEAARRIVDLRATPAAQRRMSELAEKANEGQLTDDERQEYQTYIVASNLIAILQAKARRLLAGQTAA
jgi:hypothetical protein